MDTNQSGIFSNHVYFSFIVKQGDKMTNTNTFYPQAQQIIDQKSIFPVTYNHNEMEQRIEFLISNYKELTKWIIF